MEKSLYANICNCCLRLRIALQLDLDIVKMRSALLHKSCVKKFRGLLGIDEFRVFNVLTYY